MMTLVGRRVSGERDAERGSLPFLMLVMVLCAALGAVLLTTVMQQTRTAAFDETRVRSLAAAQAGLDQALTQIRGAVSASNPSSGDAGRLPCFWAPDNEVIVDGSRLTRATVEVAYYRTDPATLNVDQLRQYTNEGGKRMRCSDNAGPYDTVELSRSPRYAVISATGKDSSRGGPGQSRGRTLRATYDFQTSDAVASAGQIRIFPTASSTTQMCMDAGSTPGMNSLITLQRCGEAKPSQQMFSYRSDLSIQLVRQPGAAANAPLLCIDTHSQDSTHSAGDRVVLRQCGAQSAPSSASTPSNQMWSVNDWGYLEGSSNKSNVDGWCIDAQSQLAGTTLTLQGNGPSNTGCGQQRNSVRRTWVPFPTTGAGAAGPANQQIVNYQRFATCLDVTNTSPTWDHLILFTCKQNPDPKNVTWNQKFGTTLQRGPTKTLIKVRSTANNTEYCLQSQAPLSTDKYPRLKACPSTLTPAFTWTVSQRYQTAAADSAELSYTDRYTIKDSQGRCLAPGANSDLYDGYYKIVVDECDGTTVQKWNADPSSLAGSVGDFREVPVPTS